MTDLHHTRRAPILDGRLSTAMELAGNSRIFADIGADHGRLSTVMLLQDSERQAIVADISASALEKAIQRIKRMGLEDRTFFSVADGLRALDNAPVVPDTVFILGMGGDTVSTILQTGFDRLNGAALVLGAQTELPLMRKALCSISYRIVREVIATENSRDYVLVRAEPSKDVQYSEEELLLGPVFLQDMPASWKPVLLRRERLLTKAVQAMQSTRKNKDQERLLLAERELQYVENALARMKEGSSRS